MVKLTDFLRLVEQCAWKSPPRAWNEQFREALSERYVYIGFGGVVQLTDVGRRAVAEGGAK